MKKIASDKPVKFKGDKNTKFKNFVEGRLLVAFSKFGSFKILVTIRDAFSLMIPLIIAGSIGILGANFIFGGGANGSALQTSIVGWIAKAAHGVEVTTNDQDVTVWILHSGWSDVANIGNHFFSFINTASFGSFSVFASFFIAWRWAKLNEASNPILGGITGLSSFLIISQVNPFFFDATGLLAALFIAFISSQLYIVFEKNKKIQVKLPKGVPPAVAKGFSALFPILFVLFIISAINVISYAIGLYANLGISSQGKVILHPGEYGFAGLFYRFISSPFLAFTSSTGGGLGVGMLYIFMYGVFWWFGIHGGNVLNGIFYPIWFGLIEQNAHMIADGMSKFDSSLAVFNMAFWETNIMATGWGITGGLIVAVQIFSKNKKLKEVNKIAGPASIFNINEPVTFGYPLMLDPVLGIPAVIIMPIMSIIAWLFISPFGLVAHSYIYVPWTMPCGIGALLSTGLDWKALVMAWIILVLSFLYYLPFVLMKNKYDEIVAKRELEKSAALSNQEIEDIFAQA